MEGKGLACDWLFSLRCPPQQLRPHVSMRLASWSPAHRSAPVLVFLPAPSRQNMEILSPGRLHHDTAAQPKECTSNPRLGGRLKTMLWSLLALELLFLGSVGTWWHCPPHRAQTYVPAPLAERLPSIHGAPGLVTSTT